MTPIVIAIADPLEKLVHIDRLSSKTIKLPCGKNVPFACAILGEVLPKIRGIKRRNRTGDVDILSPRDYLVSVLVRPFLEKLALTLETRGLVS